MGTASSHSSGEKRASGYNRILLKLSGEALAGDKKQGIDPVIIKSIASDIKEVRTLGIQVAVVVGAGNIFRGSLGVELGLGRVTGDYMGMLATVMNSLAFRDILNGIGVDTRVMTSVGMNEVAEKYTIDRALRHLDEGKVVIAAGGTGHPYFTTDTAAGLRAVELRADVLLKATRVDGVYTSDPEKDTDAEKIPDMSYIEYISRKLRVMDLTAVSLCMDNGLPIVIFDLFRKNSLNDIVLGKDIGTKIS